MYALAQFPSQGDLIKFAYDAFGIIPSNSEQILDLKIENKSFQKSLQRLAKEDHSNYLKNFNDHMQALINAIVDMFPSYQLRSGILDTLQDLFQCYLGIVLENHTYLDQKESFKFIIFSTILPRLPISILKYKECYADYFGNICSPKEFYWFLGNADQTPLSYIMQWIYDSESLTCEEFHTLLPRQLNDKNDTQDEKDLWNAKKWLNNKSLPSISNLKSTFERAFKSHDINAKRQESYLFFLLIARLSTYCIRQIKKIYGLETLAVIMAKTRQYTDAIYKDFHLFYDDEMKASLQKKKVIITQHPYSVEHKTNVDEMLNFAVFKSFSKNCLQPCQELALHIQNVGHTNDFPDFDDTYPANFNLITVKDSFNFLQQQSQSNQYLSNIENYHKGYFEVLDNKLPFEAWLEEYKYCHNNIVYPWLEQWIRAVLAFKNNDPTSALDYMEKAFDTIRYSAGKHQERFIEDYLLISLANDKGYKNFKQTYKWGVFMNHFGDLKSFFNLENDEDIKQLYQSKKKDFKVFDNMRKNMNMKTLAKLVFHWKYDGTVANSHEC